MRYTEISAISVALATVAVLFSIAISQILLGVALAACLAAFARSDRPRFELPSWWIPLSLYMLWTVLAMLMSPPTARHLPQIKKMYVLAILPVGYAVLRPRISEWTARGLA